MARDIEIIDKKPKRKCKGTKANGEPCGLYPVIGREYCKFHGGQQKVGDLNPHFRGRDHSKYLPARMLESVQDSLADRDLTSMRQDLLTIDARQVDLIKRADDGESGEAWRKLQETDKEIRRLSSSSEEGAKDQIAWLRDEMSQIIAEGLGDYQIWEEIAELIDLRRKVSESERRRMVLLSQFTPNERVLTLLQVVLGVIRDEIGRKDPEGLRRISARVGKLINLPVEVVAPQHGPRH